MELSQYAGLSSERLDFLRNLDIRKRSVYNGSTFSYGNNIYEILHNCSDDQKSKKDGVFCPYDYKYPQKNRSFAGLESEIINDINMRNRRVKNDMNYRNDILKDIIQNNVEENEMNNSKYFFSDKGYALTPKRYLARHIDDSEISKYFSTKYAVTDKASGRTEIMVERKPGCSNIIVQNFSEFDAYVTFKKQGDKKNQEDSFVHTKMGIVPKNGLKNKKCKAQAIFTEALRYDNIAPDNYWMCPTIESEKKKKTKY
ncbi:subpellicular microtubule protein 2, putative [Plasmodium gallinaceum]|uniref:Subpellicular microtubule protein 2, putative n=1 Tax=Plasmodium gallinaceum TaxID=5849 RepID=A0A1J1GWX5_PLAGA|nr:subpellicular microtubule protein 2, putative [Plasmodium gallinaceum]CRG96940.1 subpellicular microtubule protein 2, putative [Plasmodium gallinaceum]